MFGITNIPYVFAFCPELVILLFLLPIHFFILAVPFLCERLGNSTISMVFMPLLPSLDINGNYLWVCREYLGRRYGHKPQLRPCGDRVAPE
jgi:hypothetical protein